jgi:MFS family permease
VPEQRTRPAVSEDHPRPAIVLSSRAALGPVLIVAWLASLGTGSVTNGVFFVTREQHDFSPQANLFLGLVLGAIYVLGALGVAPALRSLAARTLLTPRSLVAAMNLVMAASCAAPILAPEVWTLWLFVFIYIPLTGGLWPVVESYLSGGRRGHPLRHAIGAFNLTWASAVAVSFWAMAPLVAMAPLWVIGGMGLIHVLCIPVILVWPIQPARHLEDAGEPHPPVYERLLPCFRWLLVLSYVLLAALNPLLPWKLDVLDVRAGWQTPLVSAWMIARVGMFLLLQRWHGWHGHWRTPVWTAGVMLLGFSGAMLAPDPLILMAALALFGVGAGGVYCGALYYAMAVGAAEVDAGGKHEATIGAGYALGPAAGLLAWWLVDLKLIPVERVELTTLALVGVLTAVGVALAVRSARRPPRPLAASPSHPPQISARNTEVEDHGSMRR